jgi:pyruvate kinase
MAARAECVMLNKGPYLFGAIDELDTLLGRMGEHQRTNTRRRRCYAGSRAGELHQSSWRFS